MNINMQDEYIDGYFVSSKTKKIWNIELDMLKLLDDICCLLYTSPSPRDTR